MAMSSNRARDRDRAEGLARGMWAIYEVDIGKSLNEITDRLAGLGEYVIRAVLDATWAAKPQVATIADRRQTSSHANVVRSRRMMLESEMLAGHAIRKGWWPSTTRGCRLVRLVKPSSANPLPWTGRYSDNRAG
jgi:hypothetical protein